MTRTWTAQGLETIVLCTMLAVCGVALTGCAQPADSAGTVPLATTMRSWPTNWTVTGTHSEATYVEQLTISRRGDDFKLRIVVTAQGLQGGGTWDRSVRVSASGRIDDLDPNGCGGSCAGVDGTRGYLAPAALLSLQRSGSEPSGGTERAFGTRRVICLPGDKFYAAGGMGVADDNLRLDPCFDTATGAVVAQYSPVLGDFGGPTLDTDTLRISVPAAATP